VFNPNTVETQLKPADVVKAIVGYAFGAALGLALKAFGRKAGGWLKRHAREKFEKQIFQRLGEKVGDTLKEGGKDFAAQALTNLLGGSKVAEAIAKQVIRNAKHIDPEGFGWWWNAITDPSDTTGSVSGKVAEKIAGRVAPE
jgi:hypothetical protein